jgi:hypothetical protein
LGDPLASNLEPFSWLNLPTFMDKGGVKERWKRGEERDLHGLKLRCW